MPSPFPCNPVIRECSWNKTQIEKKKQTNNNDNNGSSNKKIVIAVMVILKVKVMMTLCQWFAILLSITDVDICFYCCR